MGKTITGAEAERIGLINKAVSVDQVMNEATVFADELAKRAPLAVAAAKKGLQRSMDVHLQNELEYALYLQTLLFKTEDFKEGLRAFMERREPRFRGF